MRRLSCLVLLCVLGCGSEVVKPLPLYPVTGSVKVKGAPLKDTLVQLLPVDPSSKAKPGVATTDSEGNFVIRTNGDKGANSGKFKVVLGSVVEQQGPVSLEDATKMSGQYTKTGGPPKPTFAFPKEWASAKTTPKEIEVTDKAQIVDIDI